MSRFAIFVDGSNLFGTLKHLGIEVNDCSSFYSYVFEKALERWRNTFFNGAAPTAQLRRVYWYVVGAIRVRRRQRRRRSAGKRFTPWGELGFTRLRGELMNFASGARVSLCRWGPLLSLLLLGNSPSFGQGISSQMGSLSANTGQYANRIERVRPAVAYTEICFVDGEVDYDEHNANERTNGGDCAPGDLGWIIEQNERSAECWDAAKAECLKAEMRLPEPFEFKFACDSASTFGLADMTGNFEWASNTALPIADSVRGSGLGATMIGDEGCAHATWEWIGRSDADQCDARPFRCVR